MSGAAVWYVVRNGNVLGPLGFADLLSDAREGRLSPDDPVWTVGMADWTTAREVAGLWMPPKLPEPAPAPEAEEEDVLDLTLDEAIGPPHEAVSVAEIAQEKPGKAQGKVANFFLRHWRGELSLGWSYWGVGVLLSIGIALVTEIFAPAFAQFHLSPISTAFVLLFWIVVLVIFTVWQFVGIWRSAGRQIERGKRRYLGGLARLAVVLGLLRFGGEMFTVGGPIASQSLRLLRGEQDVPNYQIRLLRNTTELELSGGMRYGVSEALQNVLDAAPTVKIIHLNSPGGRIDEGEKLYKLIRDRQLVTYSSSQCLSACTLAFLGGKERYLAAEAKLGFHSGRFGSLDERSLPEINWRMRQLLNREAVPVWFVNKATSTPANEMWYPTQEELLSARIVTKVVDSKQFAISGYAATDENKLINLISDMPVFKEISEAEPIIYAKLVSKIKDGLKAGRSGLEVRESLSAVIKSELIVKYVRIAPDDVLVKYWETQIREAQYLQSSDPKLCVQFLFPEAGSDLDLTRHVPKEVLQSDLDALKDLIHEGARNPMGYSSEAANKDLSKVFNLLSARVPNALGVIAEPHKYFSQPGALCGAFIAFYSEILSLPRKQSGQLLRFILDQPPQ